MKKLLVLMLCAVLAVPAVGMNVNASGLNVLSDSQQQTANNQEDEGNEGGEAKKIGEDTEDQEDASFGKLAKEAINKLSDYYLLLEVTSDQKKDADAAMVTAAKQLGFKYAPAEKAPDVGVFSTDSTMSPLIKDKSGIALCIETTMKKLDKATEEKVVAPEPEPEIEVNSNIIIGGKEYDTTTANAGHQCEIAVPLVNLGDTKVTNVVITPVLSSDPTVWPFDIEKTDYSQTCDKLRGEDSGKDVLERKHTFRWNLRTRDDAVTGYTKLTFNVSYNEADGSKGSVALDYYVQVNGVEPTDENGRISTPRVIVTGFTTTPEEVYAGNTFKLTLNLKNTSKTATVSNMLFDIQGTQEGTDANNTYSAFLPTAGSSTIFVDSIGPDATKTISIELKSKADLAQKPYVVTVNMEYEDDKANPFTETASVSVPIKQEAKVDLSSIQLMPDAIEIGNEANVMFSIYNVGKTQLYNVNVKFEAASISGGDTFLGNLAPGATGNVDAYLMGQAITTDDGTVKILISYEDEEGKEAVIEKTMNLYVNEPYYPEMYEDPMMMEGMMEEKAGLPWWGYVIIGIVVVSGAAAAVLIIRKKKKAKRLAAEELELIETIEDNQSEE